jgi:hypothetical protein
VAKLSKEELEGIIERDLPGYALASDEIHPPDRSRSIEPDASGADIDALREKFLGGPGVGEGGRSADDEPDADDDEIVAVRPKDAIDPFDQRARPKTVVVSGRDKRVIGSQG